MASIRKRNGRYQAQVRRSGFAPISKTFIQHKDAQQWIRQTEIKLDRNELPPDRKQLSKVALAELVERYLEEIVPYKKGAEIETIILRAFLKHPIAQKSLTSLATSDFASYRDERLEVISSISLKRQLAPLQNMFEVAQKEWGFNLPENPLANLRLKAPENKRERRLKEGELETLIEAGKETKNPYVIPVMLFAIETAMRRGEILSLRWDQIDFKRSSATILESKNGYSRTIPLSSKALEILGIIRVFQEKEIGAPKPTGEKCPSNVILPDWGRYIQTGHLGEYQDYDLSQDLALSPSFSERIFPITPNALRLAWVRLCKRAEIEDLHFHDLRHEAISRFFELGLTVPEVASISGHRDLRMLMRYAHADRKVLCQKLSKARK